MLPSDDEEAPAPEDALVRAWGHGHGEEAEAAEGPAPPVQTASPSADWAEFNKKQKDAAKTLVEHSPVGKMFVARVVL